MKNKIIEWAFYGVCAMLIAVLAFFIMYNAGWIIGDDAIIISHTGWGHFFNPADTVTPSAGRFYPLAYIIYNVLPILRLTSENAHFALHTLVFIIFSVVLFRAAYKAVDAKQLTWRDFVLVLSAGLVCIARAYNNFLDAYSTIWMDYTLIMIWALCSYYVHKNQSLTAMIIGLLSVTWLTYCVETNFVFPLAYGIIGLLFMWKNATKLEKAYHWSLVGLGVIFLILYFFICFLHIENAYDGSHGQDITILGNAIKMFIAQKVLWVVLILVCWRAYCIIVKKDKFEFWDTMLLTGCAYCCGCAVMKLNWVLYYSLASLFMVPAIVHYLHKYLGGKWAWIIMLALALFSFRKVPGYIKINLKDRYESKQAMETLAEEYNRGNTIYWYAPEDDREWCFDLEQREWIYNSSQIQFARHINKEDYKYERISAFEGRTGVYLLPKENINLYSDRNETILSKGEVIDVEEKRELTIVKIQ
jgi:hypothetical protein